MTSGASDNRPFLIPEKPSAEVQRFLADNPEASWRESLGYVLTHWPQVRDGNVDYLIEGGVAVKLLFEERQEPLDVDILTRSQEMEKNFRNSRKFDVKSLSFWYSARLYPYNVNALNNVAEGDFLFDMNQKVTFDGRDVLILNPLGLAVSKTLRYGDRDPRAIDVSDLELLDQDPAKIQEVIERIAATLSHPHI